MASKFLETAIDAFPELEVNQGENLQADHDDDVQGIGVDLGRDADQDNGAQVPDPQEQMRVAQVGAVRAQYGRFLDEIRRDIELGMDELNEEEREELLRTMQAFPKLQLTNAQWQDILADGQIDQLLPEGHTLVNALANQLTGEGPFNITEQIIRGINTNMDTRILQLEHQFLLIRNAADKFQAEAVKTASSTRIMGEYANRLARLEEEMSTATTQRAQFQDFLSRLNRMEVSFGGLTERVRILDDEVRKHGNDIKENAESISRIAGIWSNDYKKRVDDSLIGIERYTDLTTEPTSIFQASTAVTSDFFGYLPITVSATILMTLVAIFIMANDKNPSLTDGFFHAVSFVLTALYWISASGIVFSTIKTLVWVFSVVYLACVKTHGDHTTISKSVQVRGTGPKSKFFVSPSRAQETSPPFNIFMCVIATLVFLLLRGSVQRADMCINEVMCPTTVVIDPFSKFVMDTRLTMKSRSSEISASMRRYLRSEIDDSINNTIPVFKEIIQNEIAASINETVQFNFNGEISDDSLFQQHERRISTIEDEVYNLQNSMHLMRNFQKKLADISTGNSNKLRAIPDCPKADNLFEADEKCLYRKMYYRESDVYNTLLSIDPNVLQGKTFEYIMMNANPSGTVLDMKEFFISNMIIQEFELLASHTDKNITLAYMDLRDYALRYDFFELRDDLLVYNPSVTSSNTINELNDLLKSNFIIYMRALLDAHTYLFNPRIPDMKYKTLDDFKMCEIDSMLCKYIELTKDVVEEWVAETIPIVEDTVEETKSYINTKLQEFHDDIQYESRPFSKYFAIIIHFLQDLWQQGCLIFRIIAFGDSSWLAQRFSLFNLNMDFQYNFVSIFLLCIDVVTRIVFGIHLYMLCAWWEVNATPMRLWRILFNVLAAIHIQDFHTFLLFHVTYSMIHIVLVFIMYITKSAVWTKTLADVCYVFGLQGSYHISVLITTAGWYMVHSMVAFGRNFYSAADQIHMWLHSNGVEVPMTLSVWQLNIFFCIQWTSAIIVLYFLRYFIDWFQRVQINSVYYDRKTYDAFHGKETVLEPMAEVSNMSFLWSWLYDFYNKTTASRVINTASSKLVIQPPEAVYKDTQKENASLRWWDKNAVWKNFFKNIVFSYPKKWCPHLSAKVSADRMMCLKCWIEISNQLSSANQIDQWKAYVAQNQWLCAASFLKAQYLFDWYNVNDKADQALLRSDWTFFTDTAENSQKQIYAIPTNIIQSINTSLIRLQPVLDISVPDRCFMRSWNMYSGKVCLYVSPKGVTGSNILPIAFQFHSGCEEVILGFGTKSHGKGVQLYENNQMVNIDRRGMCSVVVEGLTSDNTQHQVQGVQGYLYSILPGPINRRTVCLMTCIHVEEFPDKSTLQISVQRGKQKFSFNHVNTYEKSVYNWTDSNAFAKYAHTHVFNLDSNNRSTLGTIPTDIPEFYTDKFDLESLTGKKAFFNVNDGVHVSYLTSWNDNVLTQALDMTAIVTNSCDEGFYANIVSFHGYSGAPVFMKSGYPIGTMCQTAVSGRVSAIIHTDAEVKAPHSDDTTVDHRLADVWREGSASKDAALVFNKETGHWEWYAKGFRQQTVILLTKEQHENAVKRFREVANSLNLKFSYEKWQEPENTKNWLPSDRVVQWSSARPEISEKFTELVEALKKLQSVKQAEVVPLPEPKSSIDEVLQDHIERQKITSKPFKTANTSFTSKSFNTAHQVNQMPTRSMNQHYTVQPAMVECGICNEPFICSQASNPAHICVVQCAVTLMSQLRQHKANSEHVVNTSVHILTSTNQVYFKYKCQTHSKFGGHDDCTMCLSNGVRAYSVHVANSQYYDILCDAAILSNIHRHHTDGACFTSDKETASYVSDIVKVSDSQPEDLSKDYVYLCRSGPESKYFMYFSIANAKKWYATDRHRVSAIIVSIKNMLTIFDKGDKTMKKYMQAMDVDTFINVIHNNSILPTFDVTDLDPEHSAWKSPPEDTKFINTKVDLTKTQSFNDFSKVSMFDVLKYIQSIVHEIKQDIKIVEDDADMLNELVGYMAGGVYDSKSLYSLVRRINENFIFMPSEDDAISRLQHIMSSINTAHIIAPFMALADKVNTSESKNAAYDEMIAEREKVIKEIKEKMTDDGINTLKAAMDNFAKIANDIKTTNKAQEANRARIQADIRVVAQLREAIQSYVNEYIKDDRALAKAAQEYVANKSDARKEVQNAVIGLNLLLNNIISAYKGLLDTYQLTPKPNIKDWMAQQGILELYELNQVLNQAKADKKQLAKMNTSDAKLDDLSSKFEQLLKQNMELQQEILALKSTPVPVQDPAVSELKNIILDLSRQVQELKSAPQQNIQAPSSRSQNNNISPRNNNNFPPRPKYYIHNGELHYDINFPRGQCTHISIAPNKAIVDMYNPTFHEAFKSWAIEHSQAGNKIISVYDKLRVDQIAEILNIHHDEIFQNSRPTFRALVGEEKPHMNERSYQTQHHAAPNVSAADLESTPKAKRIPKTNTSTSKIIQVTKDNVLDLLAKRCDIPKDNLQVALQKDYICNILRTKTDRFWKNKQVEQGELEECIKIVNGIYVADNHGTITTSFVSENNSQPKNDQVPSQTGESSSDQ